MLSDVQWSLIEGMLPRPMGRPGQKFSDARTMVEAIPCTSGGSSPGGLPDLWGDPERHDEYMMSSFATRVRSRVVASVTLVGVVVGGLVVAGDGSAGAAVSDVEMLRKSAVLPDGWGDPVWADEFDGVAGSQPSRERWDYARGRGYVQPEGENQDWLDGWGDNESQYYVDDPTNVAMDGSGLLKITPTRDEQGQWYSARLETKREDFRSPEGGMLAVEARIKRPDTRIEGVNRGSGIAPAFWMLGEGNRHPRTHDFNGTLVERGTYLSWPTSGEIAVMQGVQTPGATNNPLGAEWSTTNVGTVHCGYLVTPGTEEPAYNPDGTLGPCREFGGISGATQTADQVNLSEAFHRYRVEWDDSGASEEVRFYLDGELYHSVTAADLLNAGPFGSSQDIWDKAFGSGFFLLLNVAVGGGMADLADGARGTGLPELSEWEYPNEFADPSMSVDYVRVYERPALPCAGGGSNFECGTVTGDLGTQCSYQRRPYAAPSDYPVNNPGLYQLTVGCTNDNPDSIVAAVLGRGAFLLEMREEDERRRVKFGADEWETTFVGVSSGAIGSLRVEVVGAPTPDSTCSAGGIEAQCWASLSGAARFRLDVVDKFMDDPAYEIRDSAGNIRRGRVFDGADIGLAKGSVFYLLPPVLSSEVNSVRVTQVVVPPVSGDVCEARKTAETQGGVACFTSTRGTVEVRLKVIGKYMDNPRYDVRDVNGMFRHGGHNLDDESTIYIDEGDTLYIYPPLVTWEVNAVRVESVN